MMMSCVLLMVMCGLSGCGNSSTASTPVVQQIVEQSVTCEEEAVCNDQVNDCTGEDRTEVVNDIDLFIRNCVEHVESWGQKKTEKEDGQKIVQETEKETAQETKKEVVEETKKESVEEEIVEETEEESVEETEEEIVKETEEEIVEETEEEIVKETEEEIVEETEEEIVEETSRDAMDLLGGLGMRPEEFMRVYHAEEGFESRLLDDGCDSWYEDVLVYKNDYFAAEIDGIGRIAEIHLRRGTDYTVGGVSLDCTLSEAVSTWDEIGYELEYSSLLEDGDYIYSFHSRDDWTFIDLYTSDGETIDSIWFSDPTYVAA